MSILSIFNKSQPESPSADGAAAPVAPFEAAPSGAAGPVGAPAAAHDEDAANAAVERSLKDMGDKLARLMSAMETAQKDRAGLDDQLKRMEDRTRKLASLTEVMSNPYNPFVGDAPAREDAAPRNGAPALPALDALTHVHPAPPPPASMPAKSVAAPAAAAPPMPVPVPPSPQPSEHASIVASLPPLLDVFDDGPGIVHVPQETPRNDSARLPRIAHDVDTSLLVLSWCDAMLRAASRSGLGELLDYYENVGWLGADARATVEAFADGIAVPDAEPRDWRANVELHQRSLLFIERLRSAALAGDR
ncbi:MAG: FlaD/FlaE family flagellar protein [Thermoplasmatota archaeon]